MRGNIMQDKTLEKVEAVITAILSLGILILGFFFSFHLQGIVFFNEFEAPLYTKILVVYGYPIVGVLGLVMAGIQYRTARKQENAT
jgi:hypothetical protein